MNARILSLVIGLWWGCSPLAQAAEGTPMRLRPIGVSENYLIALGTNSSRYLADRLKDPAEERHFRGLVQRLTRIGAKSPEDPVVADSLMKFVDTHEQRDIVPFQTVMAMYDSLSALGYIGGDSGIRYLSERLSPPNFTKAVRCRYGNRSSEYTASILRDATVRGIGFSDDGRALAQLERMGRNSPEIPYRGSFDGVLKKSISNNREIRKIGRAAFIQRRVLAEPPQ